MPLVAEQHPQVQKVIDGILAGQPYAKIGQSVTPPLTAMAVMRYKKRFVEPTLKGAGELASALQAIANGEKPAKELDAVSVTRAALAADPYLARTAQHRKTVDEQIAQAEDGRTIAALIGVDLKGLELDARLTGRLDTNTGSSVTINISIPGAGTVAVQAAEGGGPIIDID